MQYIIDFIGGSLLTSVIFKLLLSSVVILSLARSWHEPVILRNDEQGRSMSGKCSLYSNNKTNNIYNTHSETKNIHNTYNKTKTVHNRENKECPEHRQ